MKHFPPYIRRAWSKYGKRLRRQQEELMVEAILESRTRKEKKEKEKAEKDNKE